MFYARGNILRLLAADVTNAHLRREKWIFAEIFKITATERRAQNVDAGPKHDVLPACAGFLADGFAFAEPEFGLPRRRQTNAAGHRRGKIIGAPGGVPGVRADVLSHAVRAVVQPAARDAKARNRGGGELGIGVDEADLFFRRQA